MKVIIFVAALLGLLVCYFLYSHNKSIDRAWLTIARQALLVAQEQLRTQGAFTNQNEVPHVEVLTNALTVNGSKFQAELAAYVPSWTNSGYMIITTNSVFIWNDTKHGAMIIGGPGFESKVPPRF